MSGTIDRYRGMSPAGIRVENINQILIHGQVCTMFDIYMRSGGDGEWQIEGRHYLKGALESGDEILARLL